MEKIDKALITVAIPMLKKLVWSGRDTRGAIQDAGLNVIPSNFYSSIPSIRDVMESFEYSGAVPYLDEQIFNANRLQTELESLVSFGVDFDPQVDGDENICTSYFWKNSQFSYCDAMAYYAFLRKTKPKHVIEIGAGFSSLVALAAIKANGCGRLTCIEPYPRPFLENNDEITLIKKRAQDIGADELNAMLSDGDVLFIDSTHTVKSGSDCLHIYLRLLPAIRSNIFVHVHDIFLPFGMPQDWLLDLQIHWTEQYLLLAWITDNPYVTVFFGSAYNMKFNADLMEELMHGRYPPGGGSFWLEYRGGKKFVSVAP